MSAPAKLTAGERRELITLTRDGKLEEEDVFVWWGMVIKWIGVGEWEIVAIRLGRATGGLVDRGDKPRGKEFRECLLDHVDCATYRHAQPAMALLEDLREPLDAQAA